MAKGRSLHMWSGTIDPGEPVVVYWAEGKMKMRRLPKRITRVDTEEFRASREVLALLSRHWTGLPKIVRDSWESAAGGTASEWAKKQATRGGGLRIAPREEVYMSGKGLWVACNSWARVTGLSWPRLLPPIGCPKPCDVELTAWFDEDYFKKTGRRRLAMKLAREPLPEDSGERAVIVYHRLYYFHRSQPCILLTIPLPSKGRVYTVDEVKVGPVTFGKRRVSLDELDQAIVRFQAMTVGAQALKKEQGRALLREWAKVGFQPGKESAVAIAPLRSSGSNVAEVSLPPHPNPASAEVAALKEYVRGYIRSHRPHATAMERLSEEEWAKRQGGGKAGGPEGTEEPLVTL